MDVDEPAPAGGMSEAPAQTTAASSAPAATPAAPQKPPAPAEPSVSAAQPAGDAHEESAADLLEVRSLFLLDYRPGAFPPSCVHNCFLVQMKTTIWAHFAFSWSCHPDLNIFNVTSFLLVRQPSQSTFDCVRSPSSDAGTAMQEVDDPELAAALAMSMEDYGGASEAAPPTTPAAPVR